MKTTKILGVLVITAFISIAGASHASAAVAFGSNSNSPSISSAFGGASQGGYISDNWLANLAFHSQYPYDQTNGFGSPYNAGYNSYSNSYGYTGTQPGMYGVPYQPTVNDPRYFDEGFMTGIFGKQSAASQYASYNNWDIVDSYYGTSAANNGYFGNYSWDTYDPYYSNNSYGSSYGNSYSYQDPFYTNNSYNSYGSSCSTGTCGTSNSYGFGSGYSGTNNSFSTGYNGLNGSYNTGYGGSNSAFAMGANYVAQNAALFSNYQF